MGAKRNVSRNRPLQAPVRLTARRKAPTFLPMLRELLERRVPHIVGAYLAAGWLVLEFTDWVVNRYVLSSHLTDFVVAGWLLLLPAVFMVAWFHGKPGRDSWTRFEQVGIAINLVVATVVLIGLFRGRDLGAATTTVVVQDEEGNSIERVVPKGEFRKNVLVFPFDNRSGNPDLDWLEYGVPAGVGFDITQDLFLSVPGADQWMARLRREGFGDGLGVPLTLKRSTADRLHADHFVSGVIDDSSGTPRVTVSLYETERGKLLQERSYEGTDALELADRISRQLRHDLELPVQHIEDTPDLPVAELLTTEAAAFRAYVAGEEAAVKRLDYAGAAEGWEAAVQADSTFAFAWLRLFEARTLLNDAGSGQAALEKAMGLLYRLPERVQYPIKAMNYWLIRRDLERAIATTEMWAELFPDDVDAHLGLAQFYVMKARTADAILELERVLELDPGRVEQLQTISTLYQSEAEYAIALEYLRRYAEAAPDDPGAFSAIGDLQRQLGDHAAARESFNRSLAIDPGDVGALIRLGQLHQDLGEFTEAERGFAEALNAGTTPDERAAAHDALRGYNVFRGRMDVAIVHLRQKWSQLALTLPPFNLVQEQLNDLELYARAGRTAEGQAVLDSLLSQIPEQFAVVGAIGTFSLALDGDDPAAIEAGRQDFELLIENFGLDHIRYALPYADGRVAELRGNCGAAIDHYQQALEMGPADPWVKRGLGRCQRSLGQLDRARESLEDLLRLVPVQPQVHYELALVSEDAGNAEEAVGHLRVSLEVWDGADADYPDARRAREKLAELEAR